MLPEGSGFRRPKTGGETVEYNLTGNTTKNLDGSRTLDGTNDKGHRSFEKWV